MSNVLLNNSILAIYGQGRRNDVKARGGGRFSWKGTFELIYILRDVCKTSRIELRLIVFSIYWMIGVWRGSPPGDCAILEARLLHFLRFLMQTRKGTFGHLCPLAPTANQQWGRLYGLWTTSEIVLFTNRSKLLIGFKSSMITEPEANN